MRTRITRYLIMLSGALGLLSSAPGVRAQNPEWDLNVIGVPFDLSPFLSDIDPLYDSGQISYVIQYLGDASPTVYFNYILATDNGGIAGVNAAGIEDKLDRIFADVQSVLAFGHSGAYQVPNGPYVESFTPEDIRTMVGWSDSYRDQLLANLVQTNTLPEGTYTLYNWISAEPEGRGELLAEATATVRITTPEPVDLLQPFDGETLTELYPSFVWYPIIMPYPRVIRYRIRVVEVFENVSPEQSLEALGGESVQFEAIVENANAINYPAEGEALPLEHGKTYAWVIETLNENDEPLFDEYQSEVWTFTYLDPNVGGALTLLDPAANPFAVLQADELTSFSFSTMPQVVVDQNNWEGLALQIFRTRAADIDPVLWFQELEDPQLFSARTAAPGIEETFEEVPFFPEDGQEHSIDFTVPDTDGRDQALAWRVVGTFNGLPISSDPALGLVAASGDRPPGEEIGAPPPVLNRIIVLPNIAALTGFEDAQIVEEAGQYRINGRAQLEISLDGQAILLPVQIRDLFVEQDVPNQIRGGAFDGIPDELANANAAIQEIFVPRVVGWTPDAGFTMEGDLQLPGGPVTETLGSLTLTPQGLEGGLTSVAGADPVLFSWGDAALSLQLSSVEARFPDASLTGSGRLGILGGASTCEIDRVDLRAERMQFDVDCQPNLLVQPFGNLIPFSVSVRSIRGSFTVEFEASDIFYDMRAEGQARMSLQGGPRCDTDVTLRFRDEEGVSLQDIGANCAGITPMLSIDDARLFLHNFNLESLSFGPGGDEGGDWDFGFSADLEIAWPNLTIPIFRGLTLGSGGLRFPVLQLNEEDFRGFEPLVFGLFNLEWRGLQTDGFEVPWLNLGGNGGEAFEWDLGFDFALTLRGAPGCLQNADLLIRNARIRDGSIRAELPATVIAEPGCPIPLGPGFTLNILELGGMLVLGDPAADEPPPGLQLKANLQLGAPFACEADGPLELGQASLKFTSDGLIDGTVQNLVPNCPLRFGGFEARISDATIALWSADGSQTATLTADAVLDFPDAQQASGTLRLNLMTGEIEDMRFEIVGPFTWNLPSQDPALRFRIDRALFTMDGFTVDGRQQLLLEDDPLGVTFDQFVFDPIAFSVREGRIIFDEAFAFELGLGGGGASGVGQDVGNGGVNGGDQEVGNGGSISFRAVPFDAPAAGDPGALFGLAGEIVIDQQGLHASGEARAAINFQNRSLGDLTARFSQDFVMQFMPFGIAGGQVDWLFDGDAVAFADAEGFHPNLEFWGRELIPAVLPLPVADIAFLRLKNDQGDLLVDTASQPDGSLCLSTRPGVPLVLVLPGLDSADPPRADVTLQDVCIDPMAPELVSGEILATPPEGDPAFDLSGKGIPLNVESIAARVLDNVSVLQMDGRLILFGQDLGPNSRVRASVFSDGNLEASVELNGLGATVPLIPGSDRLTMVLNDLSGEWNVPLAAPQAGIVRLEIEGDIELRADGQRLGAGIAASYTELGFALTRFEPRARAEPFPIDLGPIDLAINSLDRLDLSFSADGGGFDFRVRLNMDLGFDLGDGSSFSINLPGVELRPSGFEFPRIEVNDGTMPRLAIEPFDLGGLSLEPLALRIGPFAFNWFEFSPGDLVDFGLSFDLALRLPDPFLDLNPPDGFTLSGFSFDAGVFEGSLEGFRFPDAIDLNIGGAMSYRIREMDINLFEEAGIQGFALNTSGSFFDGMEGCAPTLAQLSLLPGGGVSGRVAGLAPCGVLELGPLTLEFESSDVDFAVQNGTQEATLSGVALLGLPGPGQNDQRITARGNLTMDLLTGEMLGGAIEVQEPFTWSIPATSPSPFLTFTIDRARLDQQGFLINGDGSVQAGDRPINISLNDLLFDLDSFAIRSGDATIEAVISIETGLNPILWQMVDSASPFNGENQLRMTLPGNLTLNRNGLAIAGAGEASLRYQGESYGPLAVTFNDLALGLGPVEALAGEAVFRLGQSVIARYNDTGFHIDAVGLIAGQIPARIGLPTEDIAYLQLRDPETNDLFIEQDRNDQGWTLSTGRGQTVDLVLASLARPGSPAPRVNIGFDNVGLDDGFNMTSGEIRADLTDAPLDVSAIVGLPVELTGLTYVRAGGFQMRAQGRMQLPESLGGLDIQIEDLLFDDQGIASGVFEIGNYTEQYVADLQNLYNQPFGDALTLHVGGARFEFGQNLMAGFSGTLDSPVFRDGDGNQTVLFYNARYRNGAWAMTLDARHLPDGIPIGIGQFNANPRNGLRIDLVSRFALNLSGTLSMPDVLGDNFRVTLSDLNISSRGVSFGNVAIGRQVQQVDLINDLIRLQFTRVALAYQNNVLSLGLDGRLWLKPYQNVNNINEAVQFTGFTVDTEGNVDWGEARANLLTDGRKIHIIGREGAERVYVDQLLLSAADGRLQLEAGGSISLPEPFVTNGQGQETPFSFTVDTDGNVVANSSQLVLRFGRRNVIGDNPETEFILGSAQDSLATIDLKEVGLDLQNLRQPALFVNASLYLENNTRKIIEIGEVGQSGNRAGFFYPLGGEPQWNMSARGLDAKLDVGGLLRLTIQNVRSSGSDFALKLGGEVELTHPGVTGRLGWNDLTISTAGLGSVGRPDAAGGASFSLMDIVTLEVGSFVMGDGPLRIDGRLIQTTNHLRLTDARISLTDAIQGGVDEVLFYKARNGEFFLRIRDVNLQLGGNGNAFSLAANLEYESDRNGYVLRASGSTRAAGVGRLAVAGIIRNRGGLSFGLFAAAESDVGIPIIPGILSITGVGGGFFYRPTQDDINFVTQENVLGFDLNGAQPDVSQMQFAVLLYGSAGILANVLQIKTLVQITDRYTKVDADGYFYSRVFEAEMFLTVEYGDGTLVHGGVAINVDYSPILSGSGSLDFFIALQDDLQWAVVGRVNNFRMLFINARGQFMISDNGFLVDLSVGQSIDFKIITIRTSFDAAVWAIRGQSWGAYAEIDVRASVLGGAAAIGANLKGALIIDDGYLLYAAASAYVEVLWVFEGRIRVWMSLRNGDFDGGTGRNKRFERMIAEARGQRDRIQRQANETRQALASAFENINSFALSSEQLRRAGYTLLMADLNERRQFGEMALQDERNLLNAAENGQIPDYNSNGDRDADDRRMWRSFKDEALRTFQDVQARLIVAENGRPRKRPVENALASVQASMESLGGIRDEVSERFQQLQLQVIQFREEAEEAELGLRNPVRTNWPRVQGAGSDNRRITWADGDLFTVDNRANTSNARVLSDARAEDGTMDRQYREVISNVQSSLTQLDGMIMSRQVFESMGAVYVDPMTGRRLEFGRMVDRRNLNDFAEMYFQTYERSSEYFSRYANYLWELREWAVNQRSVFRGWHYNIRGTISTTRRALYVKRNGFQLGLNLAYSRKRLTHLLLQGCTLTCPDRETFEAADQAASDFRDELSGLMDVMEDEPGARTRFANLFEQSGVEFWQSVVRSGLQAVVDTSEARIESLRGQYQTQLTNIGTDHRLITDKIHQLYIARSNLAATLLGMVDEYIAWKEGPAARGQAPRRRRVQNNNPYRALRSQLATSLDPPNLSAIRVHTTDPDYMTLSTITWTAEHPQGVLETSFDISSRVRGYGLRRVGLRSLGSLRSIGLWSFQPERIFGTSETFNVTLRARSVSGTTSQRQGSFRVAYTAGADWGPDDGVDVSVVDNTPPTPPAISFPDYRRHGIWQMIGPRGRERPVNLGEAYWGSQTDNLTMVLAAVDPETDIAVFEVAIGSRPGRSDVRAWDAVYGERLLQGNNANAMIRTTIWGLNLVPGTQYFVSARARNGEGTLSRVSRFPKPLIVDNTPPNRPGRPARGLGDINLPDRYRVQVRWPVYRDAPHIRQDAAPARVPASLDVEWTASQDDESGFRRYEYVLHTQADEGPGVFGGQVYVTRDTRVVLSERNTLSDGTGLSYGATVYVSVRALNYAGGYSQTRVLGPFSVTDTSPPTIPKASARWYRNTNKVYLTSVSVDPESDIQKYQYAYGTVAGRNDLRGWTDVPVNRLRSFGNGPPYFTTTGQGAPRGQPIYINVRAVNRLGRASRIMATGPVILDFSGPPEPDIDLSFRDNQLRMVFSDLRDPESGILQLDYKIEVQDFNGSRILIDWTTFLRPVRPLMMEIDNMGRTVRLNLPGGGLNIRVRARVTNGYGLRRTFTKVYWLANRTPLGGARFNFNR